MNSVKRPSTSRINLGCGLKAPDGWINVDSSYSASLAKLPRLKRVLCRLHVLPRYVAEAGWSPDILIANLKRPLPFQDETADIVYSSHTLEHLHVEDAKNLFREIHRVLKPGGITRILVPDGTNAVRSGVLPEFTEQDYERTIAPMNARAMHYMNMGKFPAYLPPWKRIWFNYRDVHFHKYLYTDQSLGALFRWAGFRDVRKTAAFESRIAEIRDVEIEGRGSDGSLCVEGVRP